MSEVANLYNVGSSPTLAFKIGITKGAYRQLVDRLLCMQEVSGSSPDISSIFINDRIIIILFIRSSNIIISNYGN